MAGIRTFRVVLFLSLLTALTTPASALSAPLRYDKEIRSALSFLAHYQVGAR